MNRRGFLQLLGGAAMASTNPVRFLAPVGGWQPIPIPFMIAQGGHFSTPTINASSAMLTPAIARLLLEQVRPSKGFYLVR